MSRRDFHSPTTPFLSPIKSQTDINKTILTQLFSKQFLGCLKDELNTKLKQTKSNESENKKLAIQVKTYRREMQKMRVKIQELTSKNNQLANKLIQYQSQNTRLKKSTSLSKLSQSSNQIQPNILVIPPIYQRQMNIYRAVDIVITQQSTHLTRDQQIRILKERIEKLQIYKSIKDQRINDMLQKQVRFDSEIKYLKVKNDELEQQVKSLRQTIIIQSQDQKALKATYHQDKLPIIPEISISYHHISEVQKNNTYDKTLIVSFTNNINIPQSQTLNRIQKNKFQQQNSFNQIDYLIEEQLPYLDGSAQINKMNASALKVDNNTANLNQSVVMIKL